MRAHPGRGGGVAAKRGQDLRGAHGRPRRARPGGMHAGEGVAQDRVGGRGRIAEQGQAGVHPRLLPATPAQQATDHLLVVVAGGKKRAVGIGGQRAHGGGGGGGVGNAAAEGV